MRDHEAAGKVCTAAVSPYPRPYCRGTMVKVQREAGMRAQTSLMSFLTAGTV
jgi:hypothetical protein